jgi:regulator of sigma E protease
MLNLDSASRPVAGRVLPGRPAEKAGIQPGDEILSVNDVQVGTQKELIDLIRDRPGQELTLRVLRDGKIAILTVVPEWQTEAQVAQIGVELQDKLEYRMVRPGPTPVAQFREILGLMGRTFKVLLHSKKTGVGPSSLSGPVGIMGGWWQEIKHGGAMRGVWFAVLLNINLAILNLLPLPVLDGGHIVFALIERARRKPLNPRLVQNLSVTFAVLLIGFMLYITVFDVQRFFGRPKSSNAAPTNQVAPPPEEPKPATPP